MSKYLLALFLLLFLALVGCQDFFSYRLEYNESVFEYDAEWTPENYVKITISCEKSDIEGYAYVDAHYSRKFKCKNDVGNSYIISKDDLPKSFSQEISHPIEVCVTKYCEADKINKKAIVCSEEVLCKHAELLPR